MIGLIIVGDEALVAGLAAEEQRLLRLAVTREKPVDSQRQTLLELIGRADHGEGVLVLADGEDQLAARLAQSLMDQAPIALVSGFNLPMLRTAVEHCHRLPLGDLAVMVRDAGRRGIVMTVIE